MSDKKLTSKQMGDACEMLVMAELSLAGNPAFKAPDCWPGYDLIAQVRGTEQARISVKSRTFKLGAAFVVYQATDAFDWLAIVILPGLSETRRRIFIIPRRLADEKARRDSVTAKTAAERYWRIDEIAKLFSEFENNFELNPLGAAVQFNTSAAM